MNKIKSQILSALLLLFSFTMFFIPNASAAADGLTFDELTADVAVCSGVVSDFSLMSGVENLLELTMLEVHRNLAANDCTIDERVKAYELRLPFWGPFIMLTKKFNCVVLGERLVRFTNKCFNTIQLSGYDRSYNNCFFGKVRKDFNRYWVGRDKYLDEPEAYVKKDELASYQGWIKPFEVIQREFLLQRPSFRAEHKRLFFNCLRKSAQSDGAKSTIRSIAVARFLYNFFELNSMQADAAQALSILMAQKVSEKLDTPYAQSNPNEMLKNIRLFVESLINPAEYQRYSEQNSGQDFILNLNKYDFAEAYDAVDRIYDFYEELLCLPPPYSAEQDSSMPLQVSKLRVINVSALMRYLDSESQSNSSMSWE